MKKEYEVYYVLDENELREVRSLLGICIVPYIHYLGNDTVNYLKVFNTLNGGETRYTKSMRVDIFSLLEKVKEIIVERKKEVLREEEQRINNNYRLNKNPLIDYDFTVVWTSVYNKQLEALDSIYKIFIKDNSPSPKGREYDWLEN